MTNVCRLDLARVYFAAKIDRDNTWREADRRVVCSDYCHQYYLLENADVLTFLYGSHPIASVS